MTCSVAGCNRLHLAKGLCNMHYLRQKRHGSTDKPKRPCGVGSTLPSGHRMLSIDGRAVLEHRYVMEQILKRHLTRFEFVHHIDGNPANNTPINLMVVTPRKHSGLHAKYFRSETHKQCACCLIVKPRSLFRTSPPSAYDPHVRFCRVCHREWQREYRQRKDPLAGTHRNRAPIYTE